MVPRSHSRAMVSEVRRAAITVIWSGVSMAMIRPL